jgi:sucrose-6-phosphate hydrolase SacC (GH32 family)
MNSFRRGRLRGASYRIPRRLIPLSGSSRDPRPESRIRHSIIGMQSPNALPLLLLLAALTASAQRPDLPIADFESAAYSGWTVTGTAFGSGPAHGALPQQQPVSGFEGGGLVNSYLGADASTGSLESPPFTLQRDYLDFLIGGGSHPEETSVSLVVDGKTVLTSSGNETERLFWAAWDIRPWAGKSARIRIVDDGTKGWGHILADRFVQSDTYRPYQEGYRPRFHFTAPKGWLNDPNGLVYYAGEYHLFYQSNPYGTEWGNMTWGHAVSPDLIHWENLPPAFEPDAGCPAYSGSVVVDWGNTSGFGTGSEKPLVLLWTSFGCGQRLAYSNDRGRTWTKWSGNPVIPMEQDARDPKVFWHAPTRKWILTLWTPAKGGGIAFYTSPDLKAWTYQSLSSGYFECPNLWEAPIDGNPAAKKWILHGADGRYRIGSFDGTRFTAEAGPFPMDWGRHWYAGQIFSDIPAADGRVINITWMNGGKFPGMPFNQQMSIPSTLSLRNAAGGPRLCKQPVKELEALRVHTDSWKDVTVRPGENPLAGIQGELFDIEAVFEPAGAAEFGFRIRDSIVSYRVAEKTLRALDRSAPLAPAADRVTLRILLDRASLEVYGNQGEASLTSNFLPEAGRTGLECYAMGGTVKVVSLEVHRLRGSWDPADLRAAWEKARNPVSVKAQGRESRVAPGPTSHAGYRAEAADLLGRKSRPRRAGFGLLQFINTR